MLRYAPPVRLRTVAVAVAGTCGLLFALTECRQIATIDELTSAGAACASCVGSICASQESSCRSQLPSCGPRLDCELGCDPDDVSCRAACMGAPVGGAIGLVEACETSVCAPACAHACGDLLPVVPPAGAITCATCMAQQCCSQAAACAAIPDCRAGLECARAAATPDVVNTCTGARYPAGTAAYEALQQCELAGCQAECSVGGDWACLGAVASSAPTSNTIEGTLTILDGNAQSDGVKGLQVVACDLTDVDCTSPVTTPALTDAQGTVKVGLPTATTEGREGFAGYFLVTDPSGTYLPELAFPGFTLTQTGFTQSFIVSTLAEVQALASSLGRVYDVTTGSLIVTAVDCDDRPSPGMKFSLAPDTAQTVVVYTFKGFPSLSLTSTDSTGSAIGAYLPPGRGTATARDSAGKVTSVTPYLTRAGAVTVLLAPANQ